MGEQTDGRVNGWEGRWEEEIQEQTSQVEGLLQQCQGHESRSMASNPQAQPPPQAPEPMAL